MFDGLSTSTTCVAVSLNLLENTWCQHMFFDHHSVPVADTASVNLSILRTRTFAFLTYLLFLELKLGCVSIIEIPQRNRNSDFHIRPTAYSSLVTKMSTATKEFREEVKWIMSVLSSILLPLLQSFMPILIVDLASIFV